MRSFRSVAALEASGIFEHDIFHGIVHYHVSEYFRMSPKSEVYVGFNFLITGSALDKAEAIKAVTLGRVRQFGVFTANHIDTSVFQAIMDALENLEMDAVCIMGVQTPVYFNSIPDLHARVHQKVHAMNSGDYGGSGGLYAIDLGITYIPAVGTVLGTLSLSKVNQSLAYVRSFNVSDGVELEEPIFSNGTLLKNTLKAYLDELHDKGWGFFRKLQGVVGSYCDDNYTATALTSDYSSLNINRTSQKGVRGVRAALLPELNGDVEINPNTGNLAVSYIEYLKTLASEPLFTMKQAGELSGFSIDIDPTQNLLQTSNLFITITLVPKGVSRNITVNLGFALRLA
jgi:hypothetical protein